MVVESYNPALRKDKDMPGEFLVIGNTWTIRMSTITVLLAMAFLSFVISCSKQKAAKPPMPKFSELSQEDRTRLAQQRAIAAAAVKQRYGTSILKKTVMQQIAAASQASPLLHRHVVRLLGALDLPRHLRSDHSPSSDFPSPSAQPSARFPDLLLDALHFDGISTHQICSR